MEIKLKLEGNLGANQRNEKSLLSFQDIKNSTSYFKNVRELKIIPENFTNKV